MQTADMLKLPVPDAEFVNEVLKPSEIQQDMVASFSDRAEAVRSGRVDPREDNMLRITNDGRKCALDQRLMNPLLPDDEESKVNRKILLTGPVKRQNEGCESSPKSRLIHRNRAVLGLFAQRKGLHFVQPFGAGNRT